MGIAALHPSYEDATPRAFSRRIAPELLHYRFALKSRGRRECRVPAGTRGLVCNVH